MKVRTTIKVFADRHPLIGPVAWISCAQYFVVQVMAAQAWTTRYGWRSNTISDLGNTACGPFGHKYVCSPLHALMNASLIILGITMIAGALLICQAFKGNRASLVGFSLIAVSGLGALLVGLFPENTVNSLHAAAAFLPLFVGNLSMIVLSLALVIPKSLRIYTFLSGAIALIAFGLFETHSYLNLGQGGMERIVAYPQTIWLIIFGIYSAGYIRNRYNRSIN